MTKQEQDASRRVRQSAPHRGGRLVRAELKAYQDGELSGPRRWLVQWHLARCAECREEATWLQRLGKNMQNLEEARPGPHLRARILASLPDTPPPAPRFAPRTSPLQRPALRLALSGGLAVLALGVFALNRLHATQEAHNRPAAAVVPSRPPSSTRTEVALVPKTSAASPAEDPFRSAAPAPLEPDPTSASATKMANEQLKAQADRADRQQQQDWNRRLTAARFGKGDNKTLPTEAVCVVLAVSDVSAAQQRLQTWAKRAGGSIVLTKKDNEAGIAKGSEALLVRLPAERGSAMLGALKQIGLVADLSSQPLAGATGAEKMQPTPAPIRETEGDHTPVLEGSPKAEIEPHMTTRTVQAEHAVSGDLVTVTVLLEHLNRSAK